MPLFWWDLAVIAHFPTKWPRPARSHCFDCSFKLFIDLVMIHPCLLLRHVCCFSHTPPPHFKSILHLNFHFLSLDLMFLCLYLLSKHAPIATLGSFTTPPPYRHFPYFTLRFFFKRIPVFPSLCPDIVTNFFYVKSARFCR